MSEERVEGVERVEGEAGIDNLTQVIGSAQPTQMNISVVCPVCKTDNPPGEEYCVDCGFLLSSIPVEAETAVAEIPGKLVEQGTGREFPLKSGENTVGRQAADVLLTDGSVSRAHAKLTLENGVCLVEDAGSSNGTFVDGNKVAEGEKVTAANGAEIRFGGCAVRLEIDGGVEGVEGVERVEGVEEVISEAPAVVGKLIGLEETEGEYEVVFGDNTIGRRAENAIAIANDSYISGRHAVIVASEEGIHITDVGSSNGTFVNDAKLTPNESVDLCAGDGVVMGKSKFRFEETTAGGSEEGSVLGKGFPETTGESEEVEA